MSGALTVEERLTKLETEVEALKRRAPNGKEGWLSVVVGSFKDDPDFDEIVRLGREIRVADRPGDAE